MVTLSSLNPLTAVAHQIFNQSSIAIILEPKLKLFSRITAYKMMPLNSDYHKKQKYGTRHRDNGSRAGRRQAAWPGPPLVKTRPVQIFNRHTYDIVCQAAVRPMRALLGPQNMRTEIAYIDVLHNFGKRSTLTSQS